jgi:hypothetical protein
MTLIQPIQPLLILILLLGLAIYQARTRSKLLDRGIVFLIALAGIFLVINPNLSTRIANALGVTRGVDLVIYLSLIGLGFLFLIVISKIRTLESQLTALARTMAVQEALGNHTGAQAENGPELRKSSGGSPTR